MRLAWTDAGARQSLAAAARRLDAAPALPIRARLPPAPASQALDTGFDGSGAIGKALRSVRSDQQTLTQVRDAAAARARAAAQLHAWPCRRGSASAQHGVCFALAAPLSPVSTLGRIPMLSPPVP